MNLYIGDTEVYSEITLLLHNHPSDPIAVEVDLSWTRDDPAAVIADFSQPGEPTVTWIMDRSLIRDGFTRWAGAGDIRVRPISGTVTGIVLESPSGYAHFSADTEVLREFVDATFQIVPDGCEFAFCDLDAELEDLLGRAA